MKVFPYTHDPMLTLIRTREEIIDLFGEYCLEDFNSVEVPDELVKEYQDAYKRVCELSVKIEKIVEEVEEVTLNKRIDV